jgi:hypothetical protein
MLEDIGLAIITGLIIAPLSSYITVRLSLSRFKDERRWEKQFHAYERLLDALHTIKQNNINWENAFRTDRSTPATEKLKQLDVKREEAMEFLERATDYGGFILPNDVITEIRNMLDDLRSLEYSEENYNECYKRENEIIEKALEKLREITV